MGYAAVPHRYPTVKTGGLVAEPVYVAPMPRENTVKASVYFPRDLYAILSALAQREGRPLSNLIVQVMRQYAASQPLAKKE